VLRAAGDAAVAQAPLVVPGVPRVLDRTQRPDRRPALQPDPAGRAVATEQVGRLARPVSQVAAELGVSWHTVMDAVVVYGTPLVDDPVRIGQVRAVGVDETKWLAAQATDPTRWLSAVVDVERPTVIDPLKGRNASDLAGWFAQQDPAWRAGIRVAVRDLHEPFRAAFDAQIPHATQVADPFHVVAVGTRVIGRTRRRVQNASVGHRDRARDPLYRAASC
jgi:transposase